MWPGIVIILILLAMLIYLKAPKKEPVPTDEPRTADLPNPFLIEPPIDSRLDNDPANVPIQRPRPIALDARGRPITMPLIRWAQAQYERGQMFAMNPETAGQRLDTSYYQAVAILRTVEGGGGGSSSPAATLGGTGFSDTQNPSARRCPPFCPWALPTLTSLQPPQQLS